MMKDVRITDNVCPILVIRLVINSVNYITITSNKTDSNNLICIINFIIVYRF